MKKFYLLFGFLSAFFVQQLAGQTQLTNLPAFYITTDNNAQITSKETYVKANIVIKSSDVSEELNMVTEIRGRGNSTWGMPKKPYRIKLDKKTNLLGLPAQEKSWVLLANYADKTLIRNGVAFKISELVGLSFSPSARFVDVVLNGEFLGSYMVSDQIQVAPSRVEIDELTKQDTDVDIITGGYFLEIDGFASSEPSWFTSSRGLPITIKSPDEEEITSQHWNYIKNHINEFENRLFASNFDDPDEGYRAWVDVNSLINWYIACELTGNPDSFWSTYIYKKRGDDKIYFGPLWDFDIAFNNDDRLGDAVQKLMREHAHEPRTWITQMWKDEWFRKSVWQRWNELLNEDIENKLLTYIDETRTLIEDSQKRNFQKWNILNTRVYIEQFLFSTYDAGVDYLESYISARIQFLTSVLEYREPPGPFVPEDVYYTIANIKSGNVFDVENGSVEENSQLVAWEPAENRESQLWQFIPVEGAESTFLIVNKKSGLAVSSDGYGNNLKQVAANAADLKQRWRLYALAGEELYGLVNASSGYSVNNSGGGENNGNPIIEWTNNIAGSQNQQWYVRKTDIITHTPIVNRLAFNVDLYPNPATDNVNLHFNVEQNSADISVAVYDFSGKLIYSDPKKKYPQGGHVYHIPVNDYKAGIYLISIILNEKERVTQRVIVEK